MDRDVQKDNKWRAAAAQLPTRNQHPPGRLPSNSVMMVTNARQLRQALPPGHASLYRVNDAVSQDNDAPEVFGAPLFDAGQRLNLTVENLALAPVALGVVAKSKEDKTVTSLRLSSIGKNEEPESGRNGGADIESNMNESHEKALALRDTTNNSSLRDIRNDIAPPHKLEAVEGVIYKDPWGGQGDDDAHFLCESYNTRFVNAWRSHIPNDIKADFLEDTEIENHSNYPVNTETGTLMDRVEQPDSIRNPEILTREQKDHSEHWSSNYLVAREIKIREKRRLLLEKRQSEVTKAPCDDGLLSRETHQPSIRVDCVLRPAKQDDIPGIIDIYNWEIKRGYRALDTELISKDDMYAIGKSCHQECLPFIVAVQQPPDLTNPAIWPTRAAWESYMQMPEKPGPKKPVILGFAFCQTIRAGLGKGDHTGRQSVTLQLYVHHDYRNKKVGSALLDRTLTHMSKIHVPDKIQHA